MTTPCQGVAVVPGMVFMLAAFVWAELKEFRPLAEQGDAQAQYRMGVLNREGLGVPQDFAEAVRWYRRAA